MAQSGAIPVSPAGTETQSEPKSVYLVFRYFLISSITEQLAIPFQRQAKEALFQKYLSDLFKRKKVSHTYYGNTYTFYANLNFNNETFVLKLARKVNETIMVEQGNDLVESQIESIEFVYVIISTRFQLVLIQKNSQVFRDDVARNIVEDYFSTKLHADYFTMKIDTKSKPEQFWQVVEESKELYVLTVKLNAPNSPYFGDEELRDAIRMLKEETNNEEAEFTVKSSTGQLNLLGNYIRSIIQFVTVVGGFWKLKVKKKESKRLTNVDSLKQIDKAYLPKDIKEDDLSEIMDQLVKVNGIPELEQGNKNLMDVKLPEVPEEPPMMVSIPVPNVEPLKTLDVPKEELKKTKTNSKIRKKK